MKTTNPLPALRFRPFTQADAVAVSSWRYPEPYAAYDLDPWDRNVLGALLRAENQYHAILCPDEDQIVGFLCLGEDARVPGWDYDGSALDFGMGLRPDLTGHGQGSRYLAAVLSYLQQSVPARILRATVARWNQRAIRLCQQAGFRVIANFTTTRPAGTEYVVLALQR